MNILIIKGIVFILGNSNSISISGDWGLGIGDWAIPNPQSPIPNINIYFKLEGLCIIHIFKFTN